MSNGFLTVEDINSILIENGNTNIFHEIDTSNITDTYDFDNIKYDFCIVSREKTGNNYNYIFKIENNLWKGGYYITDIENNYVDVEATWDNTNKLLSFTTSENAVKLYLYLTTVPIVYFELQQLRWKLTQIPSVKNNVLPMGTASDFEDNSDWEFYFEILDGSEIDNTITAWVGPSQTIYVYGDYDNLHFEFNPTGLYYYDGSVEFVYKDTSYTIVIPSFSLFPLSSSTSNLILGKVNDFTFTYPQFDMISSKVYDCIVTYLDKKIENYCYNKSPRLTSVDIDLRGVYDLDNLKVNVYLPAFDFNYIFNFSCSIPMINSVSDLSSECGDDGASILELGANITLTSDIIITHDIKIDGKGKTIDLNNHGFILKEGVKATLENIMFNNGNTALTQQKNTDLTLNNCSFTNCTSSSYNNLGSCIYCEIDTESLTNPNDFITKIDNCTFINNHSCIIHGGKLTITNSKYHNTDTNFINKHNVAFLYQTDGRATLKHNIFDIDYDTNELCTNEQNIGFAQALIQCGLTARINSADSTQLLEDNKLPFSDAVYQNTSHVFAKYYYPQIEACVYTSPTLDKEDKAVCYTVTGENWIFKQNVQVTRASWDTQNEIRKITWED